MNLPPSGPSYLDAIRVRQVSEVWRKIHTGNMADAGSHCSIPPVTFVFASFSGHQKALTSPARKYELCLHQSVKLFFARLGFSLYKITSNRAQLVHFLTAARIACFAVFLAAPITVVADAQDRASPAVSTIAGSGLPGIADGPAQIAKFLLPSGVAVRKSDGVIFVSDEAGQRIREITPSGIVLTVAGSGLLVPPGLWVVGGYADGPALQARFNRPSGLAIGPEGALYIADSLNGCIRRLYKNIVTTVAGKCYGTAGPAVRPALDGGKDTGRFINPRGLAFDSQGNLYIADVGGGLRRLTPDGVLSTISLKSNPDSKIFSVAFADGSDPVILASSHTTVVAYHPTTKKDEVVPPPENLRPFGQPNVIAAIDSRQFLFTDASSETIRYLRLPTPPFVGTAYGRAITGTVDAESIDGAGFRDGPLPQAAFNAPMGIAIDNNVAYVADGGNRRIRKFALPKFRLSEAGLSSVKPVDSDHYEIALVGASYVFFDSLGEDSICAHLESALNESHRFSKPVRCHSVRIDAASVPRIANYIETYFGTERMDAVILYLSAWQPPAGIGSFYDVTPSVGAAAVKGTMQEMLKTLAPMHTSLAIAWGYLGSDVSDSEGVVAREGPSLFYPESQIFTVPDEHAHRIIAQYIGALSGLPIMQYDLYDDLVQYEMSAGPLPLYESSDIHFNPRGNAFLGRHIAAALLAKGFRQGP